MITGGNVEYSKADEIASVILDNQHNTPLSLDNVSAGIYVYIIYIRIMEMRQVLQVLQTTVPTPSISWQF